MKIQKIILFVFLLPLFNVLAQTPLPLTLKVSTTAATCSDTPTGTATVFGRGGAQSIGSGNFVISDERYGTHAQNITTADFNNDGLPDIYLPGRLEPDDLWLNLGGGQFEYQFVDYNSTKTGFIAEAGDLNNDGWLDLVVGNTGTVSVMLNNQDGTFSESAPISVFSLGVADVGLADMDGDGDLDAVVTGTGFTKVLFNDGSGGFPVQSINYSLGLVGQELQVGDFDGVNGPDVYVAYYYNQPDLVYFNDGSGGLLQSLQTYGTASGISAAAGDLNGDGLLDMFVGNDNGQPDKVYFGNGDGTFTEQAQNYNTGTSINIHLADVNMDGFLDAAVASHGIFQVQIWFNDGSGVFTQNSTHFYGYDAMPADYDLDGDIDVFVTANAQGGPKYYFLWNDDREVNPYQIQWDAAAGSQTTATASNLLPGTYSVTVTDADGNMQTATVTITSAEPLTVTASATDASCGTPADGTATATVSGGVDFILGNLQTLPVPYSHSNAVTGDMDSDGDQDVFLSNADMVRNDGAGSFTFLPTPNSLGDPYARLANLDGDPDLEGITADNYNGFHIWDNDGVGNMSLLAFYSISGVKQDIETLDVDNDGDLDLFIFRNTFINPGSPNSNTIWLNDGNANFTLDQEYGNEATPDAALGDFNNDGYVDIIEANHGPGVVVRLNNMDGTFSQSPVIYPRAVYVFVETGDVNNDGNLDALLSGGFGEPNRIYFGNGDGTFTPGSQELKRGAYFNQGRLADMDGDGDLDAVIPFNFSDPESIGQGGPTNGKVWLNDGTGFFEEHPQEFGSPYQLTIADFDGDGRLDIVRPSFQKVEFLYNIENSYSYQWSANTGGQNTPAAINLGAGTYTVTVTDLMGCNTSTSATVSIQDLDNDGANACDDCDDNDPNNFPGNTEICDEQDNDCDGDIDEDLDTNGGGSDEDGDGVTDCSDNCLNEFNPNQEDSDCDGVGDACDQWPGCDDTADINGNNIPDCIDLELLSNWPCGNNGNKVTICHIPPGNPANRQDICISPSAVPDHLDNHGDYIGECDQITCGGNNKPAPSGNTFKEMLSQKAFHLYPNPTNNILHLDLHNYLEQEISISIYNHLGQQMLYLNKQELLDPHLNIDLTKQQLPDGIYLIAIRSAEGQQAKQFVIAR